jgi:hypothetical protein
MGMKKKSFKAKINVLKKLSRLQKIIIGVGLLLIIIGLASLFVINRNATQKKVIYDGAKEQTQDIENGLINIPKDAKSAVCDMISADKIEAVIKQKTGEAKVSIPTTKTAEGQVSACAYNVTDKSKSPISSVIITKREFTKPDGAQRAYSLLTKIGNKNRIKVSDTSYYDTKAGQIVIVKDNSLTLAALSRTTNRSIDRSIYDDMLNLLNK